MKMFRLTLAGVLPAFVLLVALKFSADAAPASQSAATQSWLIDDENVNYHVWQPVSPLYDGNGDATAAVAVPFQSRQLSFTDRVACQRAIEEVYWRHRIWPRNRGARPPLDAVMSQAAIEKKVQDYLRDSVLLEEQWQKSITPEQLQAEMERMAEHTKQPEVLRELFAALGNDPFTIAECLARPTLTGRLQFARAEGRDEPLESSSATAQERMPDMIAAANTNYTLPAISGQSSDCIDDNWTATSTINVPKQRRDHTAVWTGSEMIVWGGLGPQDAIFLTGGRYNPSTDSWINTSTTNAPTARWVHTAVWTGSEMIVWGGLGPQGTALLTGGRYNPGTDSWTATSTTNAPGPRTGHTAVWTGSEMIVWGGGGPTGLLNTGGRYNPGTDSWTATSTTNAPGPRTVPTAVWTGSEMITWGGFDNSMGLNTGGRYNPGTDSWAATSTTNAPDARASHSAVWTGSEMIVWGGGGPTGLLNTGGRYNPGTDSWMATSTTNAPVARYWFTAVWTSSEMIIWGGTDSNNYFNTGGRYNPGTDSWTATSTTNAPAGRQLHSAVWTGSEMIVWGGSRQGPFLDTGGRYCAQGGIPAIALETAARKRRGINTVRLTWSGATSTDIDVYRDGVLVVTTPNDGDYTDSTGDTGRARYTYQVCEAGTQVCSNEEVVVFKH